MKNKKRTLNDELNNHWQTIADVMTALLLIVLLVNMILILYIVRTPEEDSLEDAPGIAETVYNAGDDDSVIVYRDWDDDDDGDGSWREYSSGGGHGGEETTPTTEPPTEPVFLEGDEKAAVYVMVIDAQTEKTIREQGVKFELSDGVTSQLALHTYYPLTVEYRIFETREEGVFYLPEKISLRTYSLHELTEPRGYDAAEDVSFEIRASYDWPEPFIVKVPLYPSRNTIRLRVTDADSGLPVGGGIYDIVAAEPIITLDGTLRCAMGEVAGSIALDESGYGESEPLFLGRYTLQQRVIPAFYASDDAPVEVNVEKKQGADDALQLEMTCRKTAVEVTVLDELYSTVTVKNAQFVLSSDAASELQLTTDAEGHLLISDLEKDTTYTLRQTASDGAYRIAQETYSFHVDADGRMEREIRQTLTIPNRLIRVNFGVRDALMRDYASDFYLTLQNNDGDTVGSWISSAVAETTEGMEPGTYYLVLNGDYENRKTVEVLDTDQVQTFAFTVWSKQSIVVAALCAVAAVMLPVLMAVFIKKKQKEKE